MVTLLIAFAAIGQQMYGDGDQRIRQDIQAAYDQYAKAVLKHDIDGTMALLTSDIVWVYPNGKEQHRSEIRDGISKWEGSIPAGTKLRFTIERLKVDSDDQVEAYVTLHYTTPQMAASKAPERTSQWHDTWILTHGTWKNSRGEQLADMKG